MKKLWVAAALVIAAIVMATFESCDRSDIPGLAPPPPAPGSP
ncbi:MAG: deoxyribonuclease, partial [Rhodococcus sp. (in: high G+C Gram-positive bacteria)]